MENNVFRKGLVIGIIVCFIGASVVPSITGYDKDVEKNDYLLNENETLNMKNDDYNNLMKQIIENGVISTDDWLEQDKLLASDGAAADYFGFSVSLSGDTALIGAEMNDDNGADSGSAYVFTRTGSTWTQQQKLLASDGAAADYFGTSVSLDGDTALIGTYSYSGADSGSAYVFTRTGSTWTQQQKLLTSDAAAGDRFGCRVSLSGDTALIGAFRNDDNGADSGSAYVFTKESGNQPPTVEITYPEEDDTVAGTITITGTAGDSDGSVTQVEVRIDSGSWWTASGTTSWSTNWDTTTVSNDQHTIYARSKDNDDDYSTEDSVTVTVDNTVPNNPPYEPSNPSPSNHVTDVDVNADLSWNGGDPDSGDTVTYDMYFGTDPDPLLYGTTQAYPATQTTITYTLPELDEETKYYWKIIAEDNHGEPTTGSIWDFTTGTGDNDPPYTPSTPSGETELVMDESGTYSTSTSDPNGDQVQYRFDWDADGAGDISGWTGLGDSGHTGSVSHSWDSTGTYAVKAQARDEHDAISSWSDCLLVEVISVTQSITRKKIIEIAEAYVSHEWYPTEKNIFNNSCEECCDDDVYYKVITPDTSQDGGWWEPNDENTGVPYQWGGFSSLSGLGLKCKEDFDEQLQTQIPNKPDYNYHAGDIHVPTLNKCECSYACGVDCSGFVSRCWNLPIKYGTSNLNEVSFQIKFDELKPGDILLKQGHVILFKEFLNDEKTLIKTIEAAINPGKVFEYEYSANPSEDGYKVTLNDGNIYELFYYKYIVNSPPYNPTIIGPPSGKAGIPYDYNFVSTDLDGDNVSYYIEWDDGSTTTWTTFQSSGPPGYSESHTWNTKGTYTIRAKAKDTFDVESDWGTLSVSMPRNRAIQTPFLNFLQQYPILYQLLQRLLKL